MVDMLLGERVPFGFRRYFRQNALAARMAPPLLEHRAPYEGPGKAAIGVFLEGMPSNALLWRALAEASLLVQANASG
jgi:hypothetical protein